MGPGVKTRAGPVQQPQPVTRCTQPDTAMILLLVGTREVVLDVDDHRLRIEADVDIDFPLLEFTQAPVAHGVLHEGLQQERGYRVLLDALFHPKRNLKAIPEPCVDEGEICPKDGHFLPDRDLTPAGIVKRLTKQVAQAPDHLVGRNGIFVHGGGDGVQRIEEEVRLQLEAQRFEP